MMTWNIEVKHYIEDNFTYELPMKLTNRAPKIIIIQALIATLWSLYYGWFGDPVVNYLYDEWFVRSNGLVPCEMCWFARILMYPIVLLWIIAWKREDASMYTPILVLSGLGIILEYYQYWYQMAHTSAEVKSFICGVGAEASCAATDVIYGWWITIPLLCLVAFVVIFVITAYTYRDHLSYKNNQ
jgi:disulfide bond formation protein DsbB